MVTGLIWIGLVSLIVIYFLGKSLWKPVLFLIGVFFQGALGALGIYIFNLPAQVLALEIPLNPFNALWVGFLGLPGLGALLAAKYWLNI